MREADEHERVVSVRGKRSGCLLTVAVHSTQLGPALGGARMWHYPDPGDAVADAERLAAAMTLRAAAAGLDLGGGKGVLAAPPGPPPNGGLRRAMLLDFGDLVEELGGDYVTAEDVGTGAEDMAVIGERTDHVVGLDPGRGGSGDPSPVTALGVVAAMRACAEERFGSRELSAVRICVVGLGHVGTRVVELLATEGARLSATDIDASRRAPMERLGARWVEPGEAITSRCDVIAPCALGGVIGIREAHEIRASVVCGAANNVLAEPAAAEVLHSRGITYAPDFIANAGGLISVYGELRGLDHARALELARGIEGTMAGVLRAARRRGVPPMTAAHELADARLRPAQLAAR